MILKDPDFNSLQALEDHKAELLKRLTQTNLLIDTVNKTIKQLKGEKEMTDNEKFEGFKKQLIDENEHKYGKEVAEKYGEQTKNESNAKLMKLTPEEYDQMTKLAADMNTLLEKAVQEGADPTGKEGLAIAQMHKNWLGFTWPNYSKEAHCGVAQMYVGDERFTAYYDKAVTGCAVFLRDAVIAYCAE